MAVEWVKVTDWSGLEATAVQFKSRFVQKQDMLNFADNAYKHSNATGEVSFFEFYEKNKDYYEGVNKLFRSIMCAPHEMLLAKVQELLLVPVLV